MSIAVVAPIENFTDTDGNPLEDGYVYIGELSKNAEVHPITVYWDKELTIPASQPLRTTGGYISRSGSASNVYTNNAYSIVVKDKQSSLVFTNENYEFSDIYTVDTIEEMLLLDVGVYTTVNVRGYYSANDGGGGLFNYDSLQSATNNGGTIIDGWVRQYSGELNVKWFGASPSVSSAINSASFQSAIDTGSIFIPDGEFTVNTINVLFDNRRITGESYNAILKRDDISYTPVIMNDGYDNFHAEGFSIDGNKSGNPLDNGTFDPSGGGSPIATEDQGDIACKNATNANIIGIRFYNSLTSPVMMYIMLRGKVINCESLGHNREGFYITSGRECIIDNCRSQGDAVQPWSLIATAGIDTDTWSYNHVISNNTCFDSQAAFLTINTNSTVVSGNIVGKKQGLASTGPGIRLGHDIAGLDADGCKIFDNVIFGINDVGTGGTGRGISIEATNKVEIYDNKVFVCSVGIGASVTQNTNLIIKDNFTEDCTGYGINLYNVTNSECIDNIAKGCDTGFSFSTQNVLIKDNYVIGATTLGYGLNVTSGLNTLNVLESNRTDSTTTNKWSIVSPLSQTFINNEWGAEVKSFVDVSGATPSVDESNYINLSNAAATDVTTLLGNRTDGIYTIWFVDSNSTLKQTGSFRLKGAVDVTPSSASVMSFVSKGTLLYEVSRSF